MDDDRNPSDDDQSPSLHYAVISADGRSILQTGTCPADMLDMQGGDLLSVEAPEGISDATHWWDGESFIAYPERPGPWAVFDFEAEIWRDPRTENDLAAELDEARTILRALRDRRLTACDWTQVPDSPLSDAERAAWRMGTR